jgi:hypothetical protein
MSVVYLKLVNDETVRGITTRDGMQIFSTYDFLNLVCQKTGSYSRPLWKRLISKNSEFIEIEKDLVLAIPSTKRIKHRTPGMTVMGLQKLLHMLNKKVTGDMYTSVETTLVRYMNGDTSMVIELDLNKTIRRFRKQSYMNNLSLHYNFEPPRTSLSPHERRLTA